MTILAITRRPIVLETQASGAMLTDTLGRLEALAGRASLYGITDPIRAKLFAAEAVETDFARDYYRDGHVVSGAVTALPGWSFGRSSSGTANRSGSQVANFATALPRLTELGLLVEEQRTNLLTYSSDMSNGVWQKLNGGTGSVPSVSADAVAAPDGSTTADRVTLALNGGTTGADFGLIYRGITYSAGSKARSIWLRADTACTVGVVGADGATYMVANVTPTWQRFDNVAVVGAGASSVQFGLRGDVPGISNAAVIDVWGYQVEEGDNVTSYIPTTSATATRAADVPVIDHVPAWPLTMLVEYVHPASSGRALALHNPDTGNYGNLIMLETAADSVNLTVRAYSADQAAFNTSGLTAGQRVRAAFTIDSGDVRFCVNGGAVQTDTAAALPEGLTKLRLGYHSDGPYLDQFIRSAMWWSRSVTDEELQGMTA